jgi:hypothetical protein
MSEPYSVVRMDAHHHPQAPPGAAVDTSCWVRRRFDPYQHNNPKTAWKLLDKGPYTIGPGRLKIAENGADSYQPRRCQIAETKALRELTTEPRFPELPAPALIVTKGSSFKRLGNRWRHPRPAVSMRSLTFNRAPRQIIHSGPFTWK